MYSGKTKTLLAAITISASSLLLSSITYAAPSCSSMLTKTEVETENLNPLEVIQADIDKAKTPKEKNALTYELVTLGNHLFDNAIDNIIALNSNPVSQEEAQAKSAQINMFIQALQVAFQVPDYVMNFAIKNRLQREHVESIKITNAQGNRIAIGFGRNQSSDEFHADQAIRQPIGFIAPSIEQDFQYFSFNAFIKELNAEQPKEVATTETTEKHPIGFITPSVDLSEESQPMAQIGFIQSKDGSDEQVELVETAINVQLGEFIVLEKQERNPIGFRRP